MSGPRQFATTRSAIPQANEPDDCDLVLDAMCSLEARLHEAEARARRAEAQLTRLHETENRVQALQRELFAVAQSRDRAEAWVKAIRRAHRSQSHAITGKLIARAIKSFDADAVESCARLF